MQGEIAQAFVRIRPDTAGFSREAEGQIKHHLLDVGKTFGGVLAVGGAIEAIKTLAEAAATSDAAFTVLDRTIKNAGASTEIFGESIRKAIEHEARLKGFHSEDLAQGFARLVSVTHDTGRAFRDLGLAQDIARARGVDITLTAQAIARAEDGQLASLKRIGVTVPAVTATYDALVKQHNILLAAGVKFTVAQKQEYEAHLASAKAIDAHTRKLSAIDIITQKFSGTAKDFGETGKGSFEKFSESMRQLEATVGEALLPSLTRAADRAGHFFETIQENGTAAKQAEAVVHDIADAVSILGDAAKIVGPPLGHIAHALISITQEVGVGKIIAIGLAFKGIQLSSALAGAGVLRVSRLLKAVTITESAIVVAGNPFTAILAGSAIAALGVAKLVGEIQRAHREENRFKDALTTDDALAATFFAHRLKALEREGLDALDARTKASQATFERFGIRIESQFARLKKGSQGPKGEEASLRAQLAAEKSDLKTIDANMAAARVTLAHATQELALSEQDLANTIRDGNQQITDSIRSAESNLFSIGSQLASTIQEFIDKIGQAAGTVGPKSAEFQRLRDAIRSGDASPGAARAASELANQLQESQAVAAQNKSNAQQRFADLITEFNRGSITLAQFNKRVAGILASEGISYKKAGQVLGIAFAEGFRAQVKGLQDQAAAIAAVPSARRSGITGLEPNIVRPLDTIRQVTQQIAAAQRARDEKALEVNKDQRALTRLEEAHTRVIRQQTTTQTRLQTKMETHLKSIDGETKKQTTLSRRQLQQQRRAAERGAARVGSIVAADDALGRGDLMGAVNAATMGGP